MRMNIFFWLAILFACSVHNVYAARPHPLNANTPPQQKEHSLYMAFGSLSINHAKAAREHIKPTMVRFRTGTETHISRFLYGGAVNLYLYSDRAPFSHDIADESSAVTTLHSVARAISADFFIGYHQPLGKRVSFDLLAGAEHIFISSRSIPNCQNCPYSHININAGAYLLSRFSFYKRDRVAVGLEFQHYFSGDLNDNFLLSVRTQFAQ